MYSYYLYLIYVNVLCWCRTGILLISLLFCIWGHGFQDFTTTQRTKPSCIISHTIFLQLLVEKFPLKKNNFKFCNTIFFQVHSTVSSPTSLAEKCTTTMPLCYNKSFLRSYSNTLQITACHFFIRLKSFKLYHSLLSMSYSYSIAQYNQRDEASHTKYFQNGELISVYTTISKGVQD